jgi:hypothetical protein
MPASLTAKGKKRKDLGGKAKNLAQHYVEFFIPRPSPMWIHDDLNFSLDQPSPLKVVPSETSYGIGLLTRPA